MESAAALGLSNRLSRQLGILRSLAIYWRPGRQRGLRELYRPFVAPGDLVFDIGAHLGDRTAAFASLGARVIALEPQPQLQNWLRRLAGGRPGVTILTEAAGDRPGTARLAVSRATPAVSTLAADWRRNITTTNTSFRNVRWQETVTVPVTTLDRLIERYGVPAFCKIDVEGFEARVLAGLTRPVPAVSVEFVAGALDTARRCIDRLAALGPYEFNAILGEGRTFAFTRWCPADVLHDWLPTAAEEASSGDLYARLPAPAR